MHNFTNKIIYGDCIDVMRRMQSASVDLIVTDPPYLVNYMSRDGRTVAGDSSAHWLKPAFAEVYRVLKPDRFMVSFYGWNKVERFMYAWKDAGFIPVSHLVFVKDYHSKEGFTKSCHENAYLLAKGNPKKPDNPPRDILKWEYTGNILHPTQKPVKALTPLIQAFSNAHDIVLDPFIGSGTTAVAAQALNRKYIGIEKIWRYCKAARDRLESTGCPAYNAEVLPDEDGNCSLCGLHKA